MTHQLNILKGTKIKLLDIPLNSKNGEKKCLFDYKKKRVVEEMFDNTFMSDSCLLTLAKDKHLIPSFL